MKSYKPKTNDRAFIIIGFIVIGIIFVVYSNINDFSITASSIESIERLAIGFYLTLFISFGAIAYGATSPENACMWNSFPSSAFNKSNPSIPYSSTKPI